MTVLEVLNAATDYLARQGIESPRLNAEHLLAHVMGRAKRLDLYLEFDRPLGEKERAPLRELVRLRAEGRPLQHLLGTVDFLGHIFKTDSRALIPRPETEQLVVELIRRGLPSRILDVGTGSGVIAVSLALSHPQASVCACDISPEALSLAAENVAAHDLENRVLLVESDLLSAAKGPWDLIVANLPYIPSEQISELSREVRHDPPLALDGGPDGLALISRLASEATTALSPGGLLALEIGHDQAGQTRNLLQAKNYRDISTLPDYQGVQRFVLASHG